MGLNAPKGNDRISNPSFSGAKMSSLREDYEIESENWTLACFGFLQFAQKKHIDVIFLGGC